MVERLNIKSAQITLGLACCCLNFDARRVKKFLRLSRDTIHQMTSIHSSPRQNDKFLYTLLNVLASD